MRHQETAGNTRPTLLNPLRSHGHMVGVSTDTVYTGTLPALKFGPHNVILGLSLKLRWDNQGSRGSKSLHIWLRRAQTNTTL